MKMNCTRNFFIVAGLCCASWLNAATYEENWTSVGKHTAAPEWFQDAKFGIYFHWGAYTVAAYGSEWYPRNMYNKDGWEYRHHVDTYGDPYGDWQYHNFILGKNDKKGNFVQFAPKLKSEGGNFDPDDWASLFEAAGAKFAGLVAEHHDGYSLWDSKVNEWNSVRLGPKLDLSAVLSKAIRAKDMKFIMTTHHAWNFSGYWHYGNVAQTDASLKKLYGQLSTDEENQLWFDKLKEIIDNYQPDLIWHDLYLSVIPESIRLKFLAYYYNKSVEWKKDVVVTSKDGFKSGEVSDFERGGPAELESKYWLTDDAISQSSWSYTDGMKYYGSKQILHALIDRISKNGNMLLNISPMADGTIPEGQRAVLLDIGDWLHKFGDAIYKTRAWSMYGEGPTKMGGGSFTGPKEGTASDVRYTKAKDESALYAIFLGWPGSSFNLSGFSKSRLNLPANAKVELMGATPGTDVELQFTQDDSGMKITLPANAPYQALAYPVRVRLREVIVEDKAPFETAATLPGTIQAEKYDKGGEGVSYHDNDYGNSGKKFREDGVDIVAVNDADESKGYAIGYTDVGEWLEYTVNVEKSGKYNLYANVASGSETSALQFAVDGKDVTEEFTVPKTGDDWSVYQKVKVGEVELTAGEHLVRMYITGSYVNVDWFAFEEYKSEEDTTTNFLVERYTAPVNINAESIQYYDMQGNRLNKNAALRTGAYIMRLPNGKTLVKRVAAPR